MLIKIDKQTNKVIQNLGTNSKFPDGNIPNVKPKDNEEFIKIHDKSELARKILLADYPWEFNETKTDIINLQTDQDKTLLQKKRRLHEIKQKNISFVEFAQIIQLNNLIIPPEMQELIDEYNQLQQELK